MATLIGDKYNDSFTGHAGDDTADGAGGNDYLNGGAGSDLLDGGTGNDDLNGGDGSDSITGGTGNDSIYDYDDKVADVLNGGGGNDYVAGSVNDTLLGGTGNDQFALYLQDPTTLHLAQFKLGKPIVVAGAHVSGFESGSFRLGPGDDVIYSAPNSSHFYAYGGYGSDTYIGSKASETISADTYLTNDRDLIEGGAGNDFLSGGLGDTFRGGTGNDIFELSATAFTGDLTIDLSPLAQGATLTLAMNTVISDVEGIAYLYLGSGDDVVNTGHRPGYIDAGAGDNTVTGGAGSDYISDGSGNDLFNGGAGNDEIFFGGSVGATVDLSNTGVQNTGYGLDTITNVESVVGTYTGDDTIVLSSRSGYASAEYGDDSIIGGAGNDVIYGGYSSPTTYSDNDWIKGGAGADTLYGGVGADTFVFTAITDGSPTAPDFIADLDNTDLIDLSKIDANTTTAGNQAFHLVAALSGVAGQAAPVYNGSVTQLELDTDGDGTPNSIIDISGDHHDFTNFKL